MKNFSKIAILTLLAFCLTCSIRDTRPSRPYQNKIDKIKLLENLKKSKKTPHPFNSVFKVFIYDKEGQQVGSATAWALKQRYSPTKLLDTTLFITAGHVCDGIKKLGKDFGKAELGSPLVENDYEIDKFFSLSPFDVCVAYKKGQQLDSSAGFILRNENKYLSPMTRLFSIQGPKGVFPIVSEARAGYVNLENVVFTVGLNSFFGSSGSPIFDENLEIVGITVRIHADFSYISVAMSVSTIRLVLDTFQEAYKFPKVFQKIMQRAINQGNEKTKI